MLLILALTTLTVAFTTTLIFTHASHAVASTDKTINFQGRLLTAAGAVVPDGNYNIQFKIYQGGAGNTAGNTGGTLDWTETHTNSSSNGVSVKDGFLSVNLGTLSPFGSTVDWSQGNLWLSMNVAGSAAGCSTFGTAPCSADGEMLPMKQITATPFAINSSQLNGITSDGFLQNTTAPQTADFNITGGGTANLLQATTLLSTAAIDTVVGNGTLNIGAATANTINIGRANDANSNINIGVGIGARTVVIGTTDNNSSVTIQGGTNGIAVVSAGGFSVTNKGVFTPALAIDAGGNTDFTLSSGSLFHIKNTSGTNLLSVVSSTNEIHTGYGTNFIADGAAEFRGPLTIQGTGAYTTPGGTSLSTAINIPNYSVPAYGSVLSFGLPSTSAATARGLLVADGRTTAHQSTIGVLSPDENSIMGLSWNGSNTTGTLSNTASSLALQGNGLNLLTATNNGGSSNVGIGNSAAAGYALDVTGDINSSTQYRINGNIALSNTALNFGGTTASTITSAAGQSLNLNGISGVSLKNNGTTTASFGSNVQIGTGSGTGTPTLLTLDKGASAPSLTGSAMNGSMYYDTTLNQVRCYDAGAWGKCTASPDSFISLSPQYANAVMHGTGTGGTMTTDFCSASLNVNDGTATQPTVCHTNETYNYYNWTAAIAVAQIRSIYVTYELPTNFKQFVSGSTSLAALTDSVDGSVTYQAYRNNGGALTACGAATTASTGVKTNWQKTVAATASDPATCGFVTGDKIVFRIDMSAKNNANTYASNLNFAFNNN